MFQKVMQFIKYNNLAVVVIGLSLLLGVSVFAAPPDVLGQKTTKITGTDNTLLLAANLDKMDMDFKVSKVEQDEKYYYVSYSFIDLVLANNAWQYQVQAKTRKISKNRLEKDLGLYMAEQLAKEHDARVKELKDEQSQSLNSGVEKRTEVVEYTGLKGAVLDMASKVFPSYEPVEKKEIPSPADLASVNNLPLATPNVVTSGGSVEADIQNAWNKYKDVSASATSINAPAAPVVSQPEAVSAPVSSPATVSSAPAVVAEPTVTIVDPTTINVPAPVAQPAATPTPVAQPEAAPATVVVPVAPTPAPVVAPTPAAQ